MKEGQRTGNNNKEVYSLLSRARENVYRNKAMEKKPHFNAKVSGEQHFKPKGQFIHF